MSKQLNILFLGGAKRVSLAEHLINAALKRDLKIRIYSYELENTVPIASVAEVIVGLRWKDEQLMPHLGRIIRDYDIHLVIPFVDPAIEIASRLGKKCPGLFVPCCDETVCRIMLDKLLSAQWFTDHDIPMPAVYQPVDVCYPAILKPRTGSASKGILVVVNEEEFRKVENPSDYLIQEYIVHACEYTVDCYVSSDGKIMSVVPRIRLETAGGEVVRTCTVKNEACIRLSRSILEAGCFRGPITIQFIQDMAKGKMYVMEINPRLGGGVIASIEAGADILLLMIDEYLGKALLPIINWKENTLMTRYFKEVIFYADNH